MLTIAAGHINYITKDKIFLIHLDTISACPKNIVSMTEKDLTEALKNTAALHSAPKAYASFLWHCNYSVGDLIQESGIVILTKAPAGPGRFRFILRVYKYMSWCTKLCSLEYEAAGPAQQLTGTCEEDIGTSALHLKENIWRT